MHRRDALPRPRGDGVAGQARPPRARTSTCTRPTSSRRSRATATVQGVVLHNATDGEHHSFAIEFDAILLQLGFSTKLGPLKEWGFELEKNAIKVDGRRSSTSLERVWACGDITTFDGKIKLIATGFGEAAIAVAQAVHTIRPDMKLQPAYSTNTGVPGGVEGQP